jgi:predicted RNase H-like nuclease (RuvC/YqgF family)
MPKKDGSMDKKQGLGRFERGGDLGRSEDRLEYENRVNRLPNHDRQLAQELSRFADLCQYFERERMDVPAEIVDELNRASRLPIPQRLETIKKLNQKLMESLPNAGDGDRIRQ